MHFLTKKMPPPADGLLLVENHVCANFLILRDKYL